MCVRVCVCGCCAYVCAETSRLSRDAVPFDSCHGYFCLAAPCSVFVRVGLMMVDFYRLLLACHGGAHLQRYKKRHHRRRPRRPRRSLARSPTNYAQQSDRRRGIHLTGGLVVLCLRACGRLWIAERGSTSIFMALWSIFIFA